MSPDLKHKALQLLSELELYFISSNAVPVDKAHISNAEFRSMQDAVHAALAAAPAGGAEPVAWQPIETAPMDGTKFLGYRDGSFADAHRVPRTDCEMWCFGCHTAAVEFNPWIKPTHWMPLPPDPFAAPTAQPQPTHAAILEALENYRVSSHISATGDALGLADVLKEPGAADISTGALEVQMLADAIYSDLDAAPTAQPEAPAEPSTKPLGYVKFRAAQTLQTDGYCDGHEWLEFCEPGEIGDDKKPAFAVYASPQAAPAAQQPAELTGWKLVKQSRLDEITKYAADPSEPCYEGRGLYDDREVRNNWSRCASNLDAIACELRAIRDGDDDEDLAEAQEAIKAQGGSQ